MANSLDQTLCLELKWDPIIKVVCIVAQVICRHLEKYEIAQFENLSKANYQALSARVAELELQNDDLKTENNKLKTEIKNLKGKLNAVKHSVDESWSNKNPRAS